MTLVFVFGAGVGVDRLLWQGGPIVDASSSFTDRPEFKELQATWDLIHDQWVLPDQVDDAKLIYGAAAGMVDALGDDGHSQFLDPEDAKAFEEASQGKFTGIGVEIDTRRDRPMVIAPIDGSPADEAGIRSGDTILEVNGESTDRVDAEEIGDMIRGEPGTSVSVTLIHRGADTPYTVDLVRRTMDVHPVSWRMLPNGIAQLRISEISTGATRDLKTALTEIRSQGATGIILDLRDDPGGLVSEAIGVASQFMPEGKTVFQQQDRDGTPKPVKTVGTDGLWLDRPLVVLANGGSASAAEIIAASLRDNGRATLIGEKTYGTGTVLLPFNQPDGSIVLLGTALWLTADGQQIWKQGVEPDKVVTMPYDAIPSRPNDDLQVTEAELQQTGDVQLLAAYDDLTKPPVATGDS